MLVNYSSVVWLEVGFVKNEKMTYQGMRNARQLERRPRVKDGLPTSHNNNRMTRNTAL